MSRVSDALLRAAAQAKSPDKAPTHPDEGAAESPFVSAWDLERLRAEAGVEDERPDADPSGGLMPGAVGEGRAPGAARDASVTSSVRLESQLAMGWPQPFATEVSEKLVAMRETDAAAVAQYRRLAAALRKAQTERAIKSVMVASATAGEGKTLTALNLALTLSEAGHGRVLLIDADLRHPRVHELFQVSSGTGLAGCLKSAPGERMPVVELTPSLTLLPAGRPEADPGDALGSDRMRAVLAEASASFDWVVLDTPPIALLPDTGLLAPLVDGAVLVIEAGKAPRATIEVAVDALGRDRLLGVVLNRASDSEVARTTGA